MYTYIGISIIKSRYVLPKCHRQLQSSRITTCLGFMLWCVAMWPCEVKNQSRIMSITWFTWFFFAPHGWEIRTHFHHRVILIMVTKSDTSCISGECIIVTIIRISPSSVANYARLYSRPWAVGPWNIDGFYRAVSWHWEAAGEVTWNRTITFNTHQASWRDKGKGSFSDCCPLFWSIFDSVQ